jgi:hypothetical protein
MLIFLRESIVFKLIWFLYDASIKALRVPS